MGPSYKHWIKVSFVYDDGYVIQLQFAFRRSLRNIVPCMEREVLYGKLFWEESPWTSGHSSDSEGSIFQVHPHMRIIIKVVGTSVS